jgi:catechol 2,3-dioxygenase-like lactoylglutathione lyase family enzyme
MLTKRHATTMLPVTDVSRARKFYEDQLGLKVKATLPNGQVVYETDGSTLALYQRAEPPKSDHTAIGFDVEDIEREVRDLRAHGVRFEHYDMPNAREHDGIYEMDREKAAWMKDPDGNILCIHQAR